MMGLTQVPLVRVLFHCCFDSVGCVSGLGSSVFVPTGVDSKCCIFAFVVFVPIGVKSEGVQLIKTFLRSNSLFSF